MVKRRVFYSFHYDNDVMRVQLVRNIGAIEEGNAPVSPSEWETVKKKGDAAVRSWIDDAMQSCSCVVVLVGSDTADRKWVKYEIEKAWNSGKGLLGIYVHNLKDPQTGTCKQGKNPFDSFTVGEKKVKLSDLVKCYNPKTADAYNDIRDNIADWIEAAIKDRK